MSFKRSTDEEDGAPGDDAIDAIDAPPKRRRIRCPKCAWEPAEQDRWFCTCGHSWNTFDTAGLCPGCGQQWTDTACLRCHQWSKHIDWYERDKDDFD